MKKKLFFLILIASIAKQSQCQGVWTQKADFGGGRRMEAVGFSIGSKGYIGTGTNHAMAFQDFWEYDSGTNIWTQKANFGGIARTGSVGFSIGTKGYIGTGFDGNHSYKDFWEWDQATNIWTQKTDFAGYAREGAIGFSIGTKGYIGTGDTSFSGSGIGSNYINDFWEWNQATNVWTQKANFAGGKRIFAVGFSMGVKGYIGTGADSTNSSLKDFWEWDQTTNIWSQKTNLSGSGRFQGVGFSLGSMGYIGTGGYKDFWEWNQSTNVWTQKTNFPGYARLSAVGFSIGNFGYFGTGDTLLYHSKNDFWEFDPSANGVNELKNKISVSVFPNPSTGIFTIQSSDPSSPLRMTNIEIRNVLGEKVYSSLNNQRLTSYEIDLRKQSKGIYFYKVTGTENEIITGKIIIQ